MAAPSKLPFRKTLRELHKVGWQDKRRTEALSSQSDNRSKLLELRRFAREIEEAETTEADGVVTAEGVSGGGSGSRGPSLKQRYANRLMVPEWMTEVPEDLATEWYVAPRPEGQRCLVIATGGSTTSRTRNGALLHKFQSALPNGSTAAQSRAQGATVLDCILQEDGQTYWVLDAISWNGCVLADCNAECRLIFWVQSKLSELPSLLGSTPFRALPVTTCTTDGLRAAHSAPVPFIRDGCYLLHKQGLYEPGATPLALLWKDADCSRYLLDTDPDGLVPEQQQVTLKWRADGTVATEDDPPLVLARMPDSFQQAVGRKLRPDLLLKFAIGNGGLRFANGSPTGADLHFLGPANQRRGRADAFSKILFQYIARRSPMQLQHLLDSLHEVHQDTLEQAMDS